MRRVGKHVHCLHVFDAVDGLELFEFLDETAVVARDVDDGGRLLIEQRLHNARMESCAWRVENHNVGSNVFPRQGFCPAAYKVATIGDTVCPRVLFREFDRLCVDFKAGDMYIRKLFCEVNAEKTQTTIE